MKHNTDEHYSPWDLLPAPEPKTITYEDGYFYHNVAKHLIRDTVRIMNNGLHIDMDKIEDLEVVLADILEDVRTRLLHNPLMQDFQSLQHKRLLKEYIADRTSKMRSKEHYLVTFKYKDMVHRSYFMHIYAEQQDITEPVDLLPTGIPKWPANLVKKLVPSYPILGRLLDNKLDGSNSIVAKALDLLATHKSDMYNTKYLEQINNPVLELPGFNPASSKQKQELFAWLNIESEAFSDTTGLPKWDRDQVERVHAETDNDKVKLITACFIDHSFAAIVKNNFIEAFYNYTVEGRLHGQYKLLGAKSGRYTSSNPNMLNMPSTKSSFAKPIKKCFTAPEGFVIAAIDYAALEDRVMADLSLDENKVGLFTENLDGHSLSATYYYPERVAAIIGPFTNNKEASKLLKKLVDEKHPEAIQVRQDAKPISFGLAYGAFPKKVAATVKIPLDEAEVIFNAYHEEMYPGVTNYRENYVLPTAKAQGYIHLGLGFNIHTEDPDRDIRTLNNATCQFWSILTALTISKLHQLIDDNGLQDDIFITSTIYDSIYFEVREDPEIIKWLNDNIIPIMTKDFMEGQVIPNEADLEIGPNWAELYTLDHNATADDIKTIMEGFKDESTETI